MPHFSRLTDIVTCNLTELLKQASDPRATLDEVIREMEEGLAGAQRSVQTARRNEERLQAEYNEAQGESERWQAEAMKALKSGDENAARMALYRKKEAHDLSAGLAQQVRVAHSTWEDLMTTYRALEARLAEAQRKYTELGGAEQKSTSDSLAATARELRGQEVEDELAELKRQLDQS